MAVILKRGLLIFLIISFVKAEARDLGSYGKSFRIVEESLIDQLRKKSNQFSDGKQEDILLEMQESFLKAARSPKRLPLQKAKVGRSFLFDPSIVVSQDIYDTSRTLIAKKGTRINPLHFTSLSTPLLFFDGEDIEQLYWAKSQKGKWILTGGRPFDLEEDEGRPIYFDQSGELTKKFGIQSIPARVMQEGDQLLVEEISLEERW